MQKKIFGSIIAAVVITAVLMSFVLVFSQLTVAQSQLTDDLKSTSDYIISGLQSSESYDKYFENLDNVETQRITVIDPSGTVIYDTGADVGTLKNHLERPEIADAINNGEGSSIRFSDTQQANIIYYAKTMPDGNILRISFQQETVFDLTSQTVPYVIIVLVVVALMAFIISRYISSMIVEPINTIDLDDPMSNDAYPELSPLLSRLESQRCEINSRIKQLTQKQHEFYQVTENMREGLVLLDRFKDVITINKSAAKMFSVTEDDAVGLNMLSIYPDEIMKKCIEKAENGKEGNAVIEKEGRKYRLLTNDVTVGGRFGGIVILLLDITDKFLAEKSRKEFSANVSHELKTPLTSISGYAEIIKDGFVAQDDIPRFAGKIYDEAKRLLTLINDIIKLSQLDEDSIEMKKEDIDIYAAANSVCERLSGIAESRGIKISLSGEHTVVRGIAKIIDEIIENLVENAVKYNKDGGEVNISVGVKDTKAYIRIKDTGVGIPKEHQQFVFERFYRVDKSHSRQTGGTGLGLSIVKNGVNLHGGSIILESEEGKGTDIQVIF